jgi:hypothetical protein
MENSGRFLFDNDSPQWYVALGERWVGPLAATEVYEKIQVQEITWAHYVWRKGQPAWKRICDTKTFQMMAPHQPDKGVQKEVKAAQKPVVRAAPPRARSAGTPPPAPAPEASEPKSWFLHHSDSQYGPFSESEIKRFLKIGKIHPKVYAWKEGMGNWERIGKIADFVTTPPPPVAKAEKAEKDIPALDQRISPRRPLVARILISNEQSVIIGICRDISIGGLQVLTEKIPGKVGTKLKMNISPSTNTSGNPIEPFVAEGVIARILEDGRGFSFRFKQLSEKAKQSIEYFIESPV